MKKSVPTPGVEVHILYWPGKIMVTGQIVMFRLELWEAGSGVLDRFDG